MDTKAQPRWLTLVISLPGRRGTARMRIWRALKAVGAAVLRDGVYLLPESDDARRVFEEQARAVRAEGGAANMFTLSDVSAAQAGEFHGLLDRGADYARIIGAGTKLRGRLGGRRSKAVMRGVRQLRRDYGLVRAIDYFPGAAAEQADQLLTEIEALAEAVAAPGEPSTKAGRIERREIREYRGRTWVSRARPWVDRLASAWLIKRFIDPRAKLLWLKDVERAPKRALGFDFDNATFTHVGNRVTFEVLLASFGLENDAALVRLGQLVHCLDIGGAPVADAHGLATILAGTRSRLAKDDALFTEASRIFDSIYQAYQEE